MFFGANIVDPDTATAQRYRDRADQVRVIAKGVTDLSVRRTLLKVAHDYDEMACSRDTVASSSRQAKRRLGG